MHTAPPFFVEETIPSSSGPIQFKLFYDKAFLTLHVYAAQNGATKDLSSALKSAARGMSSAKIYATCFLSSQKDIGLVKDALLKYSSFYSN